MIPIIPELLAMRSRTLLCFAMLVCSNNAGWCQSTPDGTSPPPLGAPRSTPPSSVAPPSSVIPAIEPALPTFTSTEAALADAIPASPSPEPRSQSAAPQTVSATQSEAQPPLSTGPATEPAPQGMKRPINPFLDARSAKLPKLPSLTEMTGPNRVDETWLKKSEVYSSYAKDSQFGPPLEGMRATDLAAGSLSQSTDPSLFEEGEYCGPATQGIVFTWAAPNFFTRPLYFEQVNFERYDTKVYPWARPVVSYATFLGTIPILPYKMGGARVHEKVYTLGHWRPGDPTPHQIHWGPKTWRGAAYQGAATTGLIFFLP